MIQSLTADGRDRSLDYKISGFHVPPGCFDAQILASVAPVPDEILLPKTSSSVFNSTVMDYLLRNLGVRHLVLCGALTDQCVEHAVRDACDLGYLVTMVTGEGTPALRFARTSPAAATTRCQASLCMAADACVTFTEERQQASLRAVAGYCRQRTTAELVAEIEGLRDAGALTGPPSRDARGYVGFT